MTKIARLIVVLAFCLSLLGTAAAVMAATPKKKVTYCPTVELVCKSCSTTPNPPSSTTNPDDQCCSFVVTGWKVCSM